jgi:hypothetical protein
MRGAATNGFGTSTLYGKVLIPGKIFNAYVIFMDSCGVVKRIATIDIPNSYQEKFSDVLYLPTRNIQLVGDAVYLGKSIGILSTFSEGGDYIATVGLMWEPHVTLVAACAVSGNRRAYVGYSGEGANYHDVFVALFDASGAPLWSKEYSSFGQDEALALAPTVAGLLVAGIHNEGVEGFVLLLDYEGAVVHQTSVPGCVLSDLLATRAGGYIVAGKITVAQQVYGLLALGKHTGEIVKRFRFELLRSEFPLILRSTSELENGNIGLMFDAFGDKNGNYLSRTVVAELDVSTGSIQRAHYLGSGDASTRFYGRALFPSPHGGFSVAGYFRTQSTPYDFFFGELTDSFALPGHSLYTPVPAGELVVLELSVSAATADLAFAPAAVGGFEQVESLSEVYAEIAVTVASDQLADACVAFPVTPPPTQTPIPAPSAAPSAHPTAQPVTHTPSPAPSSRAPTQADETNVPSCAPSLPPSIPPSGKPSSSLSAAPTSPPSTLTPTQRPTQPPSHAARTAQPSLPPLASSSGEGSVSPSLSPVTSGPTKPSGIESLADLQNHQHFVLITIAASVGMASVLLVCCSCIYFSLKNLEFKSYRNNAEILRRTGPRRHGGVHGAMAAAAGTAAGTDNGTDTGTDTAGTNGTATAGTGTSTSTTSTTDATAAAAAATASDATTTTTTTTPTTTASATAHLSKADLYCELSSESDSEDSAGGSSDSSGSSTSVV